MEDQTNSSEALSRRAYLEKENERLQKLVAEFLVKNEQLRQQCSAAARKVGG